MYYILCSWTLRYCGENSSTVVLDIVVVINLCCVFVSKLIDAVLTNSSVELWDASFWLGWRANAQCLYQEVWVWGARPSTDTGGLCAVICS